MVTFREIHDRIYDLHLPMYVFCKYSEELIAHAIEQETDIDDATWNCDQLRGTGMFTVAEEYLDKLRFRKIAQAEQMDIAEIKSIRFLMSPNNDFRRNVNDLIVSRCTSARDLYRMRQSGVLQNERISVDLYQQRLYSLCNQDLCVASTIEQALDIIYCIKDDRSFDFGEPPDYFDEGIANCIKICQRELKLARSFDQLTQIDLLRCNCGKFIDFDTSMQIYDEICRVFIKLLKKEIQSAKTRPDLERLMMQLHNRSGVSFAISGIYFGQLMSSIKGKYVKICRADLKTATAVQIKQIDADLWRLDIDGPILAIVARDFKKKCRLMIMQAANVMQINAIARLLSEIDTDDTLFDASLWADLDTRKQQLLATDISRIANLDGMIKFVNRYLDCDGYAGSKDISKIAFDYCVEAIEQARTFEQSRNAKLLIDKLSDSFVYTQDLHSLATARLDDVGKKAVKSAKTAERVRAILEHAGPRSSVAKLANAKLDKFYVKEIADAKDNAQVRSILDCHSSDATQKAAAMWVMRRIAS